MNIMNFLNTSPTFTPEVFILCKRVWEPTAPGTISFDILFDYFNCPYQKSHRKGRKAQKRIENTDVWFYIRVSLFRLHKQP